MAEFVFALRSDHVVTEDVVQFVVDNVRRSANRSRSAREAGGGRHHGQS